MRDRLAQLSTVRTLRAKQRRRDYVEAQAEMARREHEVAKRMLEVDATRSGLVDAKSPLHSAGLDFDAAEIERRSQLVARYESAMQSARNDAIRAQKAKEGFRAELERRRAAMRVADNAVDHLAIVDDRLADDEARFAELQDELQAEVPPKPRWSLS